MERMTIDERVREATREVALAFQTPFNRVELVTDRLRRQALEVAFGADPRGPIAEELAREIRNEVKRGLRTLGEDGEETRPVIDFPQQARQSKA